MSVFSVLLQPEMAPFAFSLALVAGLLLLELVSALLGMSLFGSGDSDADVDIDADLDADLDVDFDADADVDADLDMDAQADVDAPGADAATGGGWAAALSWLGVGRAPLMIWISGVLTGFGIAGYALQMVALGLFGGMAPAVAASAVALPLGLIFGARFATLIGRLAPKHQSAAISRRTFGGRRGVIAQGVATRGRPAQARFKDGHGETHYVAVEPLEDEDALRPGDEIVILRAENGVHRALRYDAARPAPSGKET